MAEVIIVHGDPGAGVSTQCEALNLDPTPIHRVSLRDTLTALQKPASASYPPGYLHHDLVAAQLASQDINQAIVHSIDNAPDGAIALIDGYPNSAHTAQLFCGSLGESGHTLLGAILLEVSLGTSIERIMVRQPAPVGKEPDPIPYENRLRDYIAYLYNKNSQTTRMAVSVVSQLAPVHRIDASGDTATVQKRFTAAIGRLALK